ncbi:MAG: putative Ig domain-containing protein, partial [Chitinophagaceae bacterium]|nr:putative Ig domain-containing protein [Anaerolineae bacterium]
GTAGTPLTVTFTVVDQPSTHAVTSFTLVNADTEADIATIVNGATYDLAALPTRNLNIRANTNPTVVGSVRLNLNNGQIVRTENGGPYTLIGDNNNNYFGFTPPIATHTLTAIPYSASNANGMAGLSLTITFTITDSGSGGGGNLPPAILPPANQDNAPGSPAAVQIAANDPNGDRLIFSASGLPAGLSIDPTTGLISGAIGSPGGSVHTVQIAVSDGTLNAVTVFTWRISTESVLPPVPTEAPPAPPVPTEAPPEVAPTGPAVIGFSVIDSDTSLEVIALTDGSVIDVVSVAAFKGLNIRVHTNPATVGSVILTYNTVTSVRNPLPDGSSVVDGLNRAAGLYTITATAYSGPDGTGVAGTPLTITFTLSGGSQ